MGARPLRRVIEHELKDPIAEKILTSPDKGGNWLVTIEGDKFIFLDQEPTDDTKEKKDKVAAAEKDSKGA